MESNDLPYAAATAILVAVLVLAWRRWGPKPDAAWKEFASAHGLTHDEVKQPSMSGELGGHQVRLFVEGLGEDQITVLRVRVSPALPDHLLLAYRSATGTDFVGKVPGDEKLGVEMFDRLFKAEGLSPEARAVLDDHRLQQALIDVCKEYFVVWIESGWLHVQHVGVFGSAQELEDFTRPALEVAHQIKTTATRVSVKRPKD